MKNKLFIGIAGIFLSILFFNSCTNTEIVPQLTLTNMTKEIPSEGGSVALTFTCNGAWSVDTTGFGWMKLSRISGIAGNDTINLTAEANSSGISRSVLLNVVSPNGQARRVTALQAPLIFPSYNLSAIAPDANGMGSTSAQIAANIKLGINIGNTMEAPGGETGWGNPVITQQLIDGYKQAGFTAVRIPCRWDGTYYDTTKKTWIYNSATHLSNTATEQIDPTWLARVKEVVQYCMNDGLYAYVEIHEGWIDCNATGARLDTIQAKQKALWEQIATTFRDFDEHLMFGSSNEPYGYPDPFTFTLPTVTNLYNFHQIFINAVRSTGGKNAYRTLIIQAPITSSDLADYYTPGGLPGLPVDNVPNRLMMEFHNYGPYPFCLDGDPTTAFFYWGTNYHSTTDLAHNATWGEESTVDPVFAMMKTEFVDKGIPTVMGEYGAFPPNGSLTGDNLALSKASRGHWYSYVTHSALTHGTLPFVWDTGEIINRNTGTVQNQQLLDSLKAAVVH